MERTLRFTSCDVSADHKVVACGFESLLGIVVSDKSSVVIEGQISLPPKTIKDSQQRGVLFANASSNEIDNCDVVPWFASRIAMESRKRPPVSFKAKTFPIDRVAFKASRLVALPRLGRFPAISTRYACSGDRSWPSG